VIGSRCRVPAAATALLLLIVGLAACAEAPVSPVTPQARSGGGDLAGLSRWQWTLIRIAVDGTSSPVPARAQGFVQISPDHSVTGDDGCAGFSGAVDVRGNSLTLRHVAMAAIGCLPDHGALDATRAAMKPLITGAPATVHLLGTTLVLDVGGRTLSFTGNALAPSIPGTAASSVQVQTT
jgi:heat shock protein HslJ